MEDEKLYFYLNNELNKDERAEVEEWISKNPDQLERIKLIWKAAKTDIQSSKPDLSGAWDRINPENILYIQKPSFTSTFLFRRLLRYAAVLMIIFGLSSGGYYTFKRINRVSWIEYSSTDKAIIDIELPDGSLVTLNKGSELIYKKKVISKNRQVTLRGEAFFLVKRNPCKPFFVYAGNTVIKVLGTSFNINAKDTNNNIIVTVKSGKVAFYEKNNNSKKLLLSAYEMGSYNANKNMLHKHENFNDNFLAWKTKTLLFNNTYMTEVCEVLRNYYDTNIVILQSNIKEKRLSARYINKSLDEILVMLDLTLNVKHRNTEDGIELLTE